jgi:hypothetical protein
MQYKWKTGDTQTDRQTTSSTEEKLDTKSQLEKGDQTGDICHNVRCADGSICTICDNADRITESAKSTEVFVCLFSQTTTVLSEWTIPKTMQVSYILLH